MDSEDGDVESDGPDKPKQATSKKYVSYSSSTRRRRKRPRHKRKQQSTVRVKPGDRVCVEVINTKTTADVLWQDGRLETNVDTLDLVSIYHIDEHQFLPGYFVNDKRGTVSKVDSNSIICESFKEESRYILLCKNFIFIGVLVAQSSGQAPFTSEFVGSNLGSDSLHSCEKS